MNNKNLQADVLLITVNDHETDAVVQAFKDITGRDVKEKAIAGRVYRYLGRVKNTRVFHALSEMGTGGKGGSQQTVDKAIRDLDPAAVVAVGIAFGVNEKKQAIGDILLSEQLRLYDLQRIGNKIVLRGARPDASTRLRNLFKGVAQISWKGQTVRPGVILTGDKLVDKLDYRNQLIKFEPESLGGEMEAAGVYVACEDEEHRVDWIVVKAISDWGDGNKNKKNKDARQKKAAKSAADFVAFTLQKVRVNWDDYRSSKARFPGKISTALPRRQRFIGREDVLAKIKSSLKNNKANPIVAIIGLGGAGKTVLALETIRQLKRDNVLWFDRAILDEGANKLLYTLGLKCKGQLPKNIKEAELVQQVREIIKNYQNINGNILIVLDDLQQQGSESINILKQALPDGSAILIASRDFTIAQKWSATTIIHLDDKKHSLSDSDAQKILFMFSKKNFDVNQAKYIADSCEKMPLALEIAAKVIAADGVKSFIERLKNEVGRLDAFALDSPARKEESVRISFEISYRSLTKQTAFIFRCLGAFARVAISPVHIDGILRYLKEDISNVEDELRRLQRYSLINKYEVANQQEVYRIHTLLHDYARDLLKGEEDENVRTQHTAYFQDFVQPYAENDFTSGNKRIGEFEIYYPQLIQALTNFELTNKLMRSKINDKTIRSTIEFIDILDKYWVLHDSFDYQIKWLGIAYEFSRQIKLPLKQAGFAERVGRAKGWKGDLDNGIKSMRQCEIVLDNIKSKEANNIRAQMYIHRASLNLQKGSLKAAEKDCVSGLKLATEKKLPRIFAAGHNILGAIYNNNNDLLLASEEFNKSLAAWRRTDDEFQAARVFDNVRSAHYYLGDIKFLRTADSKGLKYWEQFPYCKEYAAALTNSGLTYTIDRDYEIAVKLHKKAIDLSDELGYKRLQALSRLNLATTYISFGKYEEAAILLKGDLIENPEYAIDAKRSQAEVEIGRKNYSLAVELAKGALLLAREDKFALEEGAALRVLGQAYHLSGDLKKAKTHLEKSRSILRKNGYKYEHYLTLLLLVKLYKNLVNKEKAKAYSDDARTLSKKMGLKPLSSLSN